MKRYHRVLVFSFLTLCSSVFATDIHNAVKVKCYLNVEEIVLTKHGVYHEGASGSKMIQNINFDDKGYYYMVDAMWACLDCGEPNDNDSTVCWNCGWSWY